MGHRAGLDRCGKSRPPTGNRSPDRPTRSQTLCRLSYRAHNTETNVTRNRMSALCWMCVVEDKATGCSKPESRDI